MYTLLYSKYNVFCEHDLAKIWINIHVKYICFKETYNRIKIQYFWQSQLPPVVEKYELGLCVEHLWGTIHIWKTFALQAQVAYRHSDFRMTSNYKEYDDTTSRQHDISSCPIICSFVRSACAVVLTHHTFVPVHR